MVMVHEGLVLKVLVLTVNTDEVGWWRRGELHVLVLLGLVEGMSEETTCMLRSTGVLLHVLVGKGVHLLLLLMLLLLLLMLVVMEATSTINLVHVLRRSKRLVSATSNVQSCNINSLIVGLVGKGVVHRHSVLGHLLERLLRAVEEPASGTCAHTTFVVSAGTCGKGADVGRKVDEAAISTVTIVSEEAEAHDGLLATILLLVVLIISCVSPLKVGGSRVTGVHTRVHVKCI